MVGQVDLICKVLHVCEAADGNWMLYVWDGTDAPTVSYETDLDMEGENPNSLCLEAPTPPREVLWAYSLGTILTVFAGKNFKEIPDLQDGSCWVRMCNVVIYLQFGMWKGTLQIGNECRLLSNKDTTVLHLQRVYKDRIASLVELRSMRCPWSSPVTEIDEHLEYSTLRISIANPEVRHKFKCVVRVVASNPWRPDNIISFKGKYKMRLTLEDPTARIHAFLVMEDGVLFFGGYLMPDGMARKMNKLLGIGNGTDEGNPGSRNPPWVSLCLKSFYTTNVDPKRRSRLYRIFGTRLME